MRNMKKILRKGAVVVGLVLTLVSGTVAMAEEKAALDPANLADGVYVAEFESDSSMFHANEACKNKGTLRVENGDMTFHLTLVSKSIVNLFLGTVDALNEEEILQPTNDQVTYSDGMTEEVYGFEVPVKALEEEFDLALIGKKGKWYDHKVSIKNVAEATEEDQMLLDIAEKAKEQTKAE